MDKNKSKRYLEAQKRISYIHDFANKMGYTIIKDTYHHCENSRPCLSVELAETHDSEGNSYAWAWYTDTWEEF